MSKDPIQTETSRKITVQKGSTEQVKIIVTKLDNMQTSRKSLKTLQRVATDKENLTGRATKSVGKTPMKEVKVEIKDRVDLKRKKLVNNKEKSIQAGGDDNIRAEDLTSDAGPSEHYWQVLAEKRGDALREALEENKELHEKIEKLVEENIVCKQMLEETKSMVDVLTEMIGEQEESGIDMAEASTFSVTEDATDDHDEEGKTDSS